MRKRTIFILIVLGLLAGYLFYKLELNGLFVNWEQLPPQPVDEFSLQSINEFQLSISSRSGQLYHWDGESWQEGDISVEDSYMDLQEEIEPCKFSSIPFWPTSSAPKGITQCLQASWIYIEYSDRLIFASDQDGNVWRWYLSNDVLVDIFSFFAFTCLGGILLPLGGVAISTVKAVRKEH